MQRCRDQRHARILDECDRHRQERQRHQAVAMAQQPDDQRRPDHFPDDGDGADDVESFGRVKEGAEEPEREDAGDVDSR